MPEPVAPTSPVVPLAELENTDVEVDQQHCLVCYDDLHHPGILPCHHNEICGVCHLRLRHLHNNKKCPICKEEHEKIVADQPGKTFDEYPIWGEDLGGNYIYRQNVGMFFPSEFYSKTIQPLFGFQCNHMNCGYDGTAPDANIYDQMQDELEANNNSNNNSNNNNAGEDGDGNGNNQQHQKKKNNAPKSKKPPTPLRALQDHLRIKHRETLCQLCIDNKRDFVAALPRFAPHLLKKHLTKGDGPKSGFEGHPVCEFCRPKRFYDLTHLHLHLQKDHYKCHVCEKQGHQNQFFRNYQSLEKHFDRGHFMCQDNQCLQARFVVFENEIDLHAHERQVHGVTSGLAGSSKIQLEFRTRRTGYDGAGLDGAGRQQQQQEAPSEEDFNFGLAGEAFVPGALPQTNDVTLHPLHLQRTAEFREHSSVIRQQHEQEAQGASFPTLAAATAGATTGGAEAGEGGQHLSLGWTAGTTVQRLAPTRKNAGAVTQSDFPSLPSGPAKGAASAKLRVGAVSSNRQFAAMRGAAAAPVASGGGGAGTGLWGGGSAAAAAAPPSSSYEYNAAAFPAGPSARAPTNRAENLGAGNFPALGGGSKKAPKYAVTSKLAKQYKGPKQAPSWESSMDFPAPLPKKSAAAPAYIAAAPRQQQKAPSVNSQMDFPAPPTASANRNAVKNKVLGSKKKQPTSAAMNNMMKMPKTAVPAPSNPQDTLRDMQASLGPAKYKKLKKFTREFAEGSLDPDAYIDHAAALFDRGYSDPDFWKTIPILVSSCPNQASANEALRYMESLRNKAAPTAAPVTLMPQTDNTSSWAAAAPLDLTPQSFSFPAPSYGSSASSARTVAPVASATAGRGGGNWSGAPTPAPARAITPTPKTRYVVPTGKKKGAWGNGASAGPSLKKAPPVSTTHANASVSSAAANQGPQGGTATKFMAKQAKQQNAEKNGNAQNNGNKAKNKKKEKAALRDLAFGR